MCHKIISLILFCVSIVSIDSQCTCTQYLGSYCGSSVKDGLLNGDCDQKQLYQCLKENTPAIEKGLCTEDFDQATNGNLTTRLIKNDCICGEVLGTHCGTRLCYIFGNCKLNHIYRCPSSFFPAQDMGECNNCVTYELAGLDYCNLKVDKQ